MKLFRLFKLSAIDAMENRRVDLMKRLKYLFVLWTIVTFYKNKYLSNNIMNIKISKYILCWLRLSHWM